MSQVVLIITLGNLILSWNVVAAQKQYSCFKFNDIYQNYEKYEDNNVFDYETKIERIENSSDEEYYYKLSIPLKGISQNLYLEENRSENRLMVLGRDDLNLLLCFTKEIEYQYNLSKYGCYKNEKVEISFYNFDLVKIKESPVHYIKCINSI